MNRRATVLVVVFALLVTPVAVGTAVLHQPAAPMAESAVADFDDRLQRYDRSHGPSVDRQVRVVVEFDRSARLPQPDSFAVDRIYTQQGDRVMRGSAPMTTIQRLSEDPRTRSIRIISDGPNRNDATSAGVAAVGADRFHARNVTGENVTVGIIDSDFRVSHPDIASHVGAYRPFGQDGDWKHGTAVASVVADTAPDARLQLAAVGPTTSAAEYRDAIEWLRGNGADVIVDAGSYYGQPGDGSGEIAAIAERAAEDVVFVTSAGNHASRYWTGNHSGGGYVSFAEDRQGNYLNGGEPMSGSVSVSLRWDGWPETDTDYDLVLFRSRSGKDEIVTRATGHDGRPFEYLHATVPEGRYYVSVVAAEPSAENVTLELFANRGVAYGSPGVLTAPATADGVLAIGAAHNGSVREYSVSGADLVAPDAVAAESIAVQGGTSFAAPYAAGVAALVLSQNPDAAPRDIRALLRMTASDMGPFGRDDRSGNGLLNAAAIDSLLSKSAGGAVAATAATDESGADADAGGGAANQTDANA